jgi:hypothetical protein
MFILSLYDTSREMPIVKVSGRKNEVSKWWNNIDGGETKEKCPSATLTTIKLTSTALVADP